MGLIVSTLLSHVVWPLYRLVILPVSFYISIFLVVTSLFGIDTGLHQRYVQLLLRLFEFCQKSVQKEQETKRKLWLRKGDDSDTDVGHGDDDDAAPYETGTSENLFKRVLQRIEKEKRVEFNMDRCLGFARAGGQLANLVSCVVN